MNRIVIIGTCDTCPFFDNEYPDYAQICEAIDRQIKRDSDNKFSIPEDCPLEKTDRQITEI